MRLVFWQVGLSPHQLPYIVKLLDDERVDEVVVVAEQAVSEERKKIGWSVENIPGLERCMVCVSPQDDVIESLLATRTKDSVHLFSGIRGFAFIFKCLKMSLAYPVKRALITERPNTFVNGIANAKPLWLHHIRFLLQDLKYAKRISYVFAIGSGAAAYWGRVNKSWKVFPFMYCVLPHADVEPARLSGPARFLFVGSLSPWKAPLTLVNAFAANVGDGGALTFVGDGKERPKVEAAVKKHGLEGRVSIAGFRPLTEVPRWLAQSDVLVLPSVYDGWGAVVNEALQMGLYVICSDACGASDLLRGDKRLGGVFKKGDEGGLASAMGHCMSHIEQIRGERQYRLRWADSHISGEVVARYMVDCLSGEVS